MYTQVRFADSCPTLNVGLTLTISRQTVTVIIRSRRDIGSRKVSRLLPDTDFRIDVGDTMAVDCHDPIVARRRLKRG